jgi:hypothetical protein
VKEVFSASVFFGGRGGGLALVSAGVVVLDVSVAISILIAGT